MAYQPPPRYGNAQGYPSAPAPAFGYNQGAPQPNYGQGQPGGFSQPGGYGQPGGFGQPGGYGQPGGFGQPGGYGQPGGFSQPAGYAKYGKGGPAQPPAIYTVMPRPMGQTNRPDEGAVGAPGMGASFADKAIRRAFIRKVYLILTAQLSVTFGFIAMFIFVEPIKHWVRTDGMWLYTMAYFTFLGTYIALVCCPSVRTNFPGNFICLLVFTLALSFLVGTISSFHDTNIVLLAAGITAAVCLSITIFAIQTKIDFTMYSGCLFVLMMVLILFGFACSITFYIWGYNRIMDSVYAGFGALVFSLFLVYDTQKIVGERKHQLSPEEYISGALHLYVDVIMIFLMLLSLMGKNK
ncbi:hypothetical protein V1264_008528 [Littorina saxatilis]|uniref:Uncharacterized protein n=1 Tax=Littorina saxatilis TaxID=31220 RepID=A0AAN9AT95_9CAEN